MHELHQEKNGELSVRIPGTVAGAFVKQIPVSFSSGLGKTIPQNEDIKIDASETFGASVAGQLPNRCKIELAVEFEKGTKEFGIMLRTDDELENSYYIRLEPRKNRLVFDMWPRPGKRREVFYMAELERNIQLKPGTSIDIKMIADGNMGVVYVDNTIAMNFRMYDIQKGNWGVFASEGNVRFKNIRLFV